MEDWKNFSTRPFYFPAAKRLFVVFTLLLLVGCAALRVGYNNGETISYWWLNSYLDFEDDQKPWAKKQIDDLFLWHRRTQLKEYAKLLGDISRKVQGQVTQADVQADYEAFKKRTLVVIDQALPSLAELALSLQPHQIAQLKEKFAANNDKFRKEYLRGDIQDRQEARYKKVLKQAEYWFGNFSRTQEARIREWSDARPLDNELLMEDRLQHQKELVALLDKIRREKPAKAAVEAMLRTYLVAAIERGGDAEHKAFFDRSRDSTMRMAASIINMATLEQKAHAARQLQNWMDDFSKMAAKPA